MKELFTTKRLCRAGVIAALYAVLTYAFAPLAYGPFQIRPAEALCILALIYPEAIPALFIGCALSNVLSTVYDVIFGSLATLLAACATFFIGKTIKNTPLKIILGGIFPVLFNAFVIPVVILFFGGGIIEGESISVTYFTYVASIALTETVWIYGLGTPAYLVINRLRSKGMRFLSD